MRRTFRTKEVAAISGLTASEIQKLLDRGVIVPNEMYANTYFYLESDAIAFCIAAALAKRRGLRPRARFKVLQNLVADKRFLGKVRQRPLMLISASGEFKLIQEQQIISKLKTATEGSLVLDIQEIIERFHKRAR